jgi:transposase
MQGKKQYQEKLFVSFQLSDHVPPDNFYRQLIDLIDFNFLYKRTASYYGKEGQKSVDPVVFMKLMLVGYLENLNSDRRIVSTAKMRLDILYFIGYNLDEELPWHSTLSRTRQLYGQDVFTEVFRGILKQCIDKGMVSGRRQAVDGVYVKANASLESMVEREILADAVSYGKELDANQEEVKIPVVDIKKDRSTEDDEPAPKKNPTNKTHYSPSDPDAKMSVKPGKVTALNYLGQVSVDTTSHVITHIQAFKADQRDSQCLPSVIGNLVNNLKQNGMCVEEIIADKGYSSGEALMALERNNITGYIPNRTQFVYERPGFIYHSEGDFYSCPNNKKLIYKGTFETLDSVYNKEYKASKKECNKCPLKTQCSVYRKYGSMIRETIDKPYYQRMHVRMQTKKAKILMKKRQSTVEPVIGTLVTYLGMKKVNTKGLEQANKCMILSAVAYNIKKLLKHKTVLLQGNVQQMQKGLKAAIKCLSGNLKFIFVHKLPFSFSHCQIGLLPYFSINKLN